MTRSVRLGFIPTLHALSVLLYVAAHAAVVGGMLGVVGSDAARNREALLAIAAVGAVALPSVALVQFGLAVATVLRLRRVQRGTRGRTRFAVLAGAGVAHVLAEIALALLLPPRGVLDLLAHGAGAGVLREVAYDLPPATSAAYWVLLGLHSAATVLLVGTAVSTWFVIPPRARRAAWAVVDLVLVLGFAVASSTLPLRPLDDAPGAATEPAIRLAVTTLFAARMLARALPFLLDLVERTGFRPLVAARMMRAGKSGFLTAIGLLSILAVTVATGALVTVLSVMGGFRADLKRKILGNHAHVVVDKEHGAFEGWAPVLQRVRALPGVLGAAPYVHGEVMVSSTSNLSGAVLRGIDPDTASEVIDLERNLRRGRMQYLREPRLLVELPPDRIDGALLPMDRARSGASPKHPDEDAPTGAPASGASLLRAIDEVLARAADAEVIDAVDGGTVGEPASVADGGTENPTVEPRRLTSGDPTGLPRAGGVPGIRGDLEDFLLEEPAHDARRDVLPGIIVGQELARSLRLYVGDEVNVVSPLGGLGPSGPVPKARAFRVAGVFYSGMYEYDMKYVYVTLPVAQEFLSTGDAISGIEIKVADIERAPAVAAAVRRGLGRGDLRVRDWQETNKNLFGALALEKLAMFVTLGIAILVAGFCVFGTLTLMVQEKRKQVGVLKAMGATAASIVAIFLYEGLLIGLLGSGIGLGLGYVACFAAEHFGIAMNPEVYYIDRLPVAIDGTEFAAVFVSSLVVCMLATVFPAMLASWLRPVDALRD
jgi:lipoprotein-releasing system permease protein